ncbi:MAG: electron transfer flavoprotein subunit beta/FixA family protein [Sphingomicrobium sp.]
MAVLLLVEHDGVQVRDATLPAVTAAGKLGEVHALVAGSNVGAVPEQAAKIAGEEQPEIIVLGKQAIDDDNNATGQMLAALLGWGQGAFASKVEVGDGATTVTREVDGGLETERLKLPAVVTTDLRLNEPRYASLPNIMKAKSKPLAMKTPDELGVDIARRIETLKVAEPPKRQAGDKVGSVDELVGKLKALGVAQ